ncbi:MAG: hypothetical protein M5U28_55010 [Sandaracinaceae bacterium]|nr:hypothetical protein [Sandaracinaceae bacterium]
MGEWSEPVFLIVNEIDLGVVPRAVWEQVRERLVSILDDHVSFEESDEQRPAARSSKPTPAEPVRSSGRRARPLRVLVAEHDGELPRAAPRRLRVGRLPRGRRGGRTASPPADRDAPRPRAGRGLRAPEARRGRAARPRARALPGSVVRLGVLIGAALPQILVPEHEAADLVLGQPLTAAGIVERVRELLGSRDTRSADR